MIVDVDAPVIEVPDIGREMGRFEKVTVKNVFMCTRVLPDSYR